MIPLIFSLWKIFIHTLLNDVYDQSKRAYNKTLNENLYTDNIKQTLMIIIKEKTTVTTRITYINFIS